MQLIQMLLVNEDYPTTHSLMTMFYERYECQITTARNSEEALEKIKKVWFNIIVINCVDDAGAKLAQKISRLINDRKIEKTPLIGMCDTRRLGHQESTGFLQSIKNSIGMGANLLKESAPFFDQMYELPLKPLVLDNERLRKILEPSDLKKHIKSMLDNEDLQMSNEVLEALDILELPKSATLEKVKQRYRILAKQYHPDKAKCSKEEAEERFYRINNALEVIMKAAIK